MNTGALADQIMRSMQTDRCGREDVVKLIDNATADLRLDKARLDWMGEYIRDAIDEVAKRKAE